MVRVRVSAGMERFFVLLLFFAVMRVSVLIAFAKETDLLYRHNEGLILR